jgi:hypothetical protein
VGLLKGRTEDRGWTQIAYFNARREVHEKANKDEEPFDPESVKTPPLESRVHIKTKEYEDYVSMMIWMRILGRLALTRVRRGACS